MSATYHNKVAVTYHKDRFPPSNIRWEELLPLIGPANASLARFDGILSGVPNSRVLLSPLMTQEAVLSSRIEGTQATMGEVLEFEAGNIPLYNTEEEKARKEGDIQEILNYRTAIQDAEHKLSKIPLSGRLIKGAHTILLKGVRGRHSDPGNYRRTQNWIGPPGCKQSEARFVPLSASELSEGMSGWEKYIQSDQLDTLVQLAIAHAEFEAIHPFLDGNGRLGRMLIPLFLFDRKLLTAPTFYVSEYLEANRDEYYERLLAVSRDNDWTGWCVFFLKALLAQAKANTLRAEKIIKLYESKKSWVTKETHSQYSMQALDFIFKRPVFQASDFVKQSEIPEATAKRIIRLLRERKLLSVWREASGRKSAILGFSELLNVAEGRAVF